MARRKRRGNYPKRRLPLDERHYRAIEMLTRVPRMTHDEIAQELGICRMTLARWRKRPDFNREYQRLMRAITDEMYKRIKNRVWASAMRGEADGIERYLNAAGLI